MKLNYLNSFESKGGMPLTWRTISGSSGLMEFIAMVPAPRESLSAAKALKLILKVTLAFNTTMKKVTETKPKLMSPYSTTNFKFTNLITKLRK
jgi:hypothetical protein